MPWLAQLTLQGQGLERLDILGETTLPALPSPLRIAPNAQGLTLSYETEAGRPYRVEYTESLSSPFQWGLLDDFMGDGSVHQLFEPFRPGQNRFYRLGGF